MLYDGIWSGSRTESPCDFVRKAHSRRLPPILFHLWRQINGQNTPENLVFFIQITTFKQARYPSSITPQLSCSHPRLKPIRSYMGGKSGGCLSTLVCYIPGEGQRRTVPEEAVFCGSRIGMN